MGSQIVKEAEVADLTRRMAEIQHDLRLLRGRLTNTEGPLALIAASMCAGAEDAFGEAAERLIAAAPVITSVME